MKRVAAMFLGMLTLFVFTVASIGCKGKTPAPEEKTDAETTYVVMFDSAGGTTLQSQFVSAGEKAERPPDPKKASTATEDYMFTGWFYEDREWDFETDAVTCDITLVARYYVDSSTINF